MSSLAILLGCAPPLAARNPTGHVEELHDDAEASAKVVHGQKTDLLIVPIPQSSPTLGTGLTVAGVLFYNPNEAPRPWISGIGAMRTTNDSWAVAAFHSMTLGNDKIRAIALGGYADLNLKFYGIGPEAGDRDVSVTLNESGFLIMLQGQMRVAKHFYAGARYQYLDLTTRIRRPDPVFPDLDLPPRELVSKLSAFGPSISYDRRDDSLTPRNGELVTATWMFSDTAIGSDFNYDKVQIGANLYRPVGDKAVIAARAALCGVSSGAPFYDLCLYGFSNDLRGYETGRYRDRATWAVQYEVRQHLFGRFGAAAFAGIGGVAPSLGNLGDSKLLPAAGVGLRYQPSKDTRINFRLDFAVGKDSNAIYFSLGEAF